MVGVTSVSPDGTGTVVRTDFAVDRLLAVVAANGERRVVRAEVTALGGTGSAPKYCVSLDEAARQRLREAIRHRLPTGPDGEILLATRAWAAKGRVAS